MLAFTQAPRVGQDARYVRAILSTYIKSEDFPSKDLTPGPPWAFVYPIHVFEQLPTLWRGSFALHFQHSGGSWYNCDSRKNCLWSFSASPELHSATRPLGYGVSK
jgi:hypothetical protein